MNVGLRLTALIVTWKPSNLVRGLEAHVAASLMNNITVSRLPLPNLRDMNFTVSEDTLSRLINRHIGTRSGRPCLRPVQKFDTEMWIAKDARAWHVIAGLQSLDWRQTSFLRARGHYCFSAQYRGLNLSNKRCKCYGK